MSRAEHYTLHISRDDDGRIAAVVDATSATSTGGRVVVRSTVTEAAQSQRPYTDPSLEQDCADGNGLRRAPFELLPVSGAHAELLLRAVKPIRRADRIVEVAEGIAAMAREEASYWHAQTERRHGLQGTPRAAATQAPDDALAHRAMVTRPGNRAE